MNIQADFTAIDYYVQIFKKRTGTLIDLYYEDMTPEAARIAIGQILENRGVISKYDQVDEVYNHPERKTRHE